MRNINVLEKIAEALLIDYSSVYFIDAQTNEYQWFSVDPHYHSLNLQKGGDDFFVNIIDDAKKVVHQDDLHIFLEDMSKENLLKHMEEGSMRSIEYRLMIEGVPVYHTLRLLRRKDDDFEYFIIGVINIDKQVKEREKNLQIEKEREVYNQIAESLASSYDVIYYVDTKTDNYTQFTARTIYGQLNLQIEGKDFFTDARKNTEAAVHPDDREFNLSVLDKDFLISALKDKKQFSIKFRMIVDGNEQYTRFTVMWAADRQHFIIGVENVDSETRKEMEQARLLSEASEKARRDELTGVKNKMAYQELEESIQANLDSGIDYLPFAIAVCDLNNLKEVNDLLGHKVGDDYIKAACKMVCDTFDHSPVFRIGGDEFAVLIRGKDYEERENLVNSFKERVRENVEKANGPIVAIGMAEYERGEDFYVSDVFEKADILMYENKNDLKQKR